MSEQKKHLNAVTFNILTHLDKCGYIDKLGRVYDCMREPTKIYRFKANAFHKTSIQNAVDGGYIYYNESTDSYYMTELGIVALKESIPKKVDLKYIPDEVKAERKMRFKKGLPPIPFYDKKEMGVLDDN